MTSPANARWVVTVQVIDLDAARSSSAIRFVQRGLTQNDVDLAVGQAACDVMKGREVSGG